MNIAGYAYAGKYKEYDNDIIEEDKSGRRRVSFHPTPAAGTPEMEQFVLAYQEARDNPHIDQLLLVPCVILDFLCVPPFRDGNERLSRLLSLLLLYRNGVDVESIFPLKSRLML